MGTFPGFGQGAGTGSPGHRRAHRKWAQAAPSSPGPGNPLPPVGGRQHRNAGDKRDTGEAPLRPLTPGSPSRGGPGPAPSPRFPSSGTEEERHDTGLLRRGAGAGPHRPPGRCPGPAAAPERRTQARPRPAAGPFRVRSLSASATTPGSANRGPFPLPPLASLPRRAGAGGAAPGGTRGGGAGAGHPALRRGAGGRRLAARREEAPRPAGQLRPVLPPRRSEPGRRSGGEGKGRREPVAHQEEQEAASVRQEREDGGSHGRSGAREGEEGGRLPLSAAAPHFPPSPGNTRASSTAGPHAPRLCRPNFRVPTPRGARREA